MSREGGEAQPHSESVGLRAGGWVCGWGWGGDEEAGKLDKEVGLL